MLAELMVRAASRRRTPPQFRPHIDDAVRYWSRGQRQSRAWAPHLAKARSLIDTTIDDISSRRTVAVLGSGPLFDVPLESLARTFKRVILIDRIHLPVIDARLARYANIERLWHEVPATADKRQLAVLDDIAELDWVISTGLLAPLAAQAGSGARAVIDSHLDRLAEMPCPVTLIADLDYRLFNRHGVLLDSGDLLQGRAIPRSGLRWKWEIAPFGEEHPQHRRVHYMAAWADWRDAANM
jgi:hypothetical protein